MRLLRIEIAIAALLLAPFAGYAVGYVFADVPARVQGILPAGPATDMAGTREQAVREAGA